MEEKEKLNVAPPSHHPSIGHYCHAAALLHEQLTKVQETCNSWEARICQAECSITRQKTAISRARKSIRFMKEKLACYKEHIRQLQKESEQTMRRKRMLEEKMKELARDIQECETRVNEMDELLHRRKRELEGRFKMIAVRKEEALRQLEETKREYVPQDEYESNVERNACIQSQIKKQTAIGKKHKERIESDKIRTTQLEQENADEKMVIDDLLMKQNQFERSFTPRPSWEELLSGIPNLEALDKEWREEEAKKESAHRMHVLGMETSLPSKTLALSSKAGDVKRAREQDRAFGRTHALSMEMCREIRRLGYEAEIAAQYNDVIKRLKKAEHDLAHAKKTLKETIDSMPFLTIDYDEGKDIDSVDPDKIVETEEPSHFIALGTGKDVPRFLRYRGKVRNRKIAKADLEVLVNQIWNERRMQRILDPNEDTSLADFFYLFLRQKFGVQSIIAEWGYNILFGLEKYIWDADLELFLLCLTGAVSEEVYNDQVNMLFHLEKVMRRMDTTYLGYKEVHGAYMQHGVISRHDLEETLRNFFPLKSTNDFNAVLNALAKDCKGSKLRYQTLFAEDTKGSQGMFIEEIRDQHLKEIQEFTLRLEKAIIKRDVFGKGKILVVDIREAIQSVDPDVEGMDLEAYLSRGLQCR